MNETIRKYYSKIILFGEYTIICHSRLLSVPFRRFEGALIMAGRHTAAEETEQVSRSRHELGQYLEYIQGVMAGNGPLKEFNAEDLRKDINKGLYYDSNIPQGYGLGSSGALCAALYERYYRGDRKDAANLRAADLVTLKERFSIMENYFHGRSSGIDPLTCYLGQPLLFISGRHLELVRLGGTAGGTFFLCDTKTRSQTGPLVSAFLQDYQDLDFRTGIDALMIPAVEECIEGLLREDHRRFVEGYRKLSAAQLKYLSRMIPGPFLGAWNEGLDTDRFYMKLCGSGGGGYLMGYTDEFPGTLKWFRQRGFELIKLISHTDGFT